MSDNCPPPLNLFTKKQLLFTYNTNANSVRDPSDPLKYSYIVRNSLSANISRKTKNVLKFCAYNQNIYIIAGENSIVEKYIFDPNNRFTDFKSFASITKPRYYLSAHYFDLNELSWIMVFGGKRIKPPLPTGLLTNVYPRTVEYFDLENPDDGWKVSSVEMVYPRAKHTSQILSGQSMLSSTSYPDDSISWEPKNSIYLIGGTDNYTSPGKTFLVSPIDVYVPNLGSKFLGPAYFESSLVGSPLASDFTTNPGILDRFQAVQFRIQPCSAIYKGKLYLIGGQTASPRQADANNHPITRCSSTVFYLDRTLSTIPGYPVSRPNPPEIDRVGSEGVYSEGAVASPFTNWFPAGWTGSAFPSDWPTPSGVLDSGPYQPGDHCLQVRRVGAGASVLGNFLYVAGGSNAGQNLMEDTDDLLPLYQYALDSVEYYDGVSWKFAPSMNYKRYGARLITFNNLLYAIGGQDENGNFVSQMETFDPTQWFVFPKEPWRLTSITNNTHPFGPGVTITRERLASTR